MTKDLSYYKRRFKALKEEREPFIGVWQDVAQYVFPHCSYEIGGKKAQKNKVVDNTATLALNTLTSCIMTAITSPARPWFSLRIVGDMFNDIVVVKEWLSEVEGVMRHVFNKSNLYHALPSIYRDIASFGTGALLVLEDDLDDVRFYPLSVGSYALAEDERLEVDTVYREISMTVIQMVQRFGINAVSARVQDMYRKEHYDNAIDVVHAIERRGTSQQGGYEGVYFEKGTDTLLDRVLYDEFPCPSVRWSVAGSHVYGESPAMAALGDIKQLQHQHLVKAQAMAKMVNPPLTGPANLDKSQINSLPGGVNISMDGGAGLRPVYMVDPRLSEFLVDMQEVQSRIQRAFHADMFLSMLQDQNREMTAREVVERHEEKLMIIGPVLERIQSELLKPLIMRTYSLLSKAGKIPKPPKILEGVKLQIGYTSALSNAQQGVVLSSLNQAASFIGQLAQIKPHVLDTVNADAWVREYMNLQHLPPSLLFSEEEVQTMRIKREE